MKTLFCNIDPRTACAVILTLFIILGVTAFHASPTQHLIKAYKSHDRNYLILEAEDEHGKHFLPLPTNRSDDWFKLREWHGLAKEFAQYFAWNVDSVARSTQRAIRSVPDGNWGRASWKKLADELNHELIDTYTGREIRFGQISFHLVSEPKTPKSSPAYASSGSFFKSFFEWKAWNEAYSQLVKAKPREISMDPDQMQSAIIDWVAALQQEDFDIYIENVPEDYLVSAEIAQARFYIKRIPNVHPGTISVPVRIEHKKFSDIGAETLLHVAFPNAPFITGERIIIFMLAIISLCALGYIILLKTRSRLPRRVFRRTSTITVLKGLFSDLERRIVHEIYTDRHSDVHDVMRKVWNLSDQLASLVGSERLDESLTRRLDDPSQSIEATFSYIQECLVNLKQQLKRYAERDQNQVEALYRVNARLLGRDESREQFSMSLTKQRIAALLAELEEAIKALKSRRDYEKERFNELLKSVNKVFNPLVKDQDFQSFFSTRFWSTESNRSAEMTSCLADKFRSLEVAFPKYLNEIESQLDRARRLVVHVLKPRIESLSQFNFGDELDQLLTLFDRYYLGKPNARPLWASGFPLIQSNETKPKMQQAVWEEVWDNENLGASMQIVKKLLFKLRMILDNTGELGENTFKQLYELEMLVGAIHHILQSIMLSCSRLYHDIDPGKAVNLDFVSQEGDLNILRDSILKELTNDSVKNGRIIDLHYWGVSRVGKNLVDTIKSRVVVKKAST